MATRSDYDSAWKDALGAYFSEFLQMLRPHTYARIDWTCSPKFLDKELQALIRSSARGRLLVDKLVSVQLRDGQNALLLIHVEVQTRCDAEFATRMLDYHVRLKANYPNSRLLDMAVLTGATDRRGSDARLGTEVMSYRYREEDCGLTFTFPVMRLEWWRTRMGELQKLASANPFAVVVLAQLEATGQGVPEEKLVRKVELIRHFEQWGITRDNRRILFRVIDAMISLPPRLEPEFADAVMKLEKEHKMTYVTSVERVQLRRAAEEGERRGEKRGEKLGEKRGTAKSLATQIIAKFGVLPDWARARIDGADEAALNGWVLRILDAERIEDVFI